MALLLWISLREKAEVTEVLLTDLLIKVNTRGLAKTFRTTVNLAREVSSVIGVAIWVPFYEVVPCILRFVIL